MTLINSLLSKAGLRLQPESSYKALQGEASELRSAQKSLLRVIESANNLKRFKHGFVDLFTETYYPVLGELYLHRYTRSGLFVAVTKLLATVLECQQLDAVIKRIDKMLSMEMYKDDDAINSFPSFFANIDAQRAELSRHRAASSVIAFQKWPIPMGIILKFSIRLAMSGL